MKYVNEYIELDNEIHLIITNITKQKKYTVIIDNDDYNKVRSKKWSITNDGRCRALTFNYSYPILLHRYITNCPKEMVVHHINLNPLDNRKCNLKIMTISEHSHLHNLAQT